MIFLLGGPPLRGVWFMLGWCWWFPVFWCVFSVVQFGVCCVWVLRACVSAWYAAAFCSWYPNSNLGFAMLCGLRAGFPRLLNMLTRSQKLIRTFEPSLM